MNKSLLRQLPGVNWQSGMDVLVSFVRETIEECRVYVEAKVQRQLDAEVEALLGRRRHARRRESTGRRIGVRCQRCGSQRQQAFLRHGHRRRQVQTTLGPIEVWYPRVVCQCGGSAELKLSLVKPYQRFWGDTDLQLQQWAQWGLSLRQMQTALSDMLSSSVGIRRLNTSVQAMRQPVPIRLLSVPPILLLDAIWVTVLRPTGDTRLDRQGRLRPVKRKHKLALLVALGVWPSGKWVVLDWHLADQEDRLGWETLLVRLETRGVYRQRGLQLIVHDGNNALMGVLDRLYPQVPHQRCLFHKLRNLWQAIRPPEGLSAGQIRTFKRPLMRQLRALFQAPTLLAALHLREAFCRQWATTQPELVASLLRDWDQTVAFFQVRAHFPHWPRARLRTTSLLERVNRMLRRLFRAASAFHSDAGLLAAVARVLSPHRAV